MIGDLLPLVAATPVDPERFRVAVIVLICTVAGLDLGIAFLMRAERGSDDDGPTRD